MKYFIFTFLLFFESCKPTEQCSDTKRVCYNPHFYYQNLKGQNLLSEYTPNHYNLDDIHILFKWTDGQLHAYHLEYDDLVKNNEYIGVYVGFQPPASTFYLQVSKTDIDTVVYERFCKGQIDPTGITTAIRYNGKLVYELNNPNLNICNSFTIVKRDDELQ